MKHRIRTFAGLLAIPALALVLAGCPAPTPGSANPTISSFTVAPSSLTSAGGTATLVWSTSNATSFLVTSSPNLAGLPSAPGGTVAIPANVTASAMTYTLTLTATGAAGTTAATSTTSVTVAAAGAGTPNPTITSFTANPNTFTSAGGTATLLWSANNATSLEVTSTPSLAGLPAASGGTVAIPANATSNPVNYTLFLTATGAAGTTAEVKTVGITVDPFPTQLTKNDWQVDVTYAGGSDRLNVIIDQNFTILSGSGRDNDAEVDFVTSGTVTGDSIEVTFTLTNGGSYRGVVTCTGTIVPGPPQTITGFFTSPDTVAVGGTSGNCTMM